MNTRNVTPILRLPRSGNPPLPKPTKPLRPTPLLTVAEAAVFLGLCTKTVRGLVKGGRLLAHRIGRSIRISEADLRAFLAANR
ncbi:MAG: Helix-turn-helix domain [Rubritepida sp.]|nr:Helix-turn-helix domain [Rubritepida sp.]